MLTQTLNLGLKYRDDDRYLTSCLQQSLSASVVQSDNKHTIGLKMASPSVNHDDRRPVFFFDVDDCLYPQSLEVPKIMHRLLEKFMTEHLSISKEEATELMNRYYLEHGLSVVGLEKNHQIDPLLFNEHNDNALPLDDLLSPDPDLRATLQKFDPSKVKLWLFTNAHVTHGRRVVKLLGVDDMFEGITYCDYSDRLWTLKPGRQAFEKAEKEAGVSEPDQCYFVDDSPRNCQAALVRGWHAIRIVDPKASNHVPDEKPLYRQIQSLKELHNIFPQFLR